MRILYPIINGEITGGNMICLAFIDEAVNRGWKIFVNSPTEGGFTEIIKDKCEKIYHFDTRKFYNLQEAIKLSVAIKKDNVDLIHSHTPFAGTFLSRIAGKLSNAPVITHAHIKDRLNPNPLVRKFEIFLNRISSKFTCNRIIAVSKAVKEVFIKQGHEEDMIEVVYNGIDLEIIKPQKTSKQMREELGISDKSIVIGEVGRLCETKGQHLLIKAAPKVIDRFPNSKIIFVGKDLERDGVYERELIDLAKNLNIENKIIFTGYRDDVIDIINSFDLFVLPSLAEGLPVVILEAMACGIPVVATSVGGNEEIVKDGVTGTIVPPGDSESLARAIIYNLENPEVSNRMGERSYERVKKYFTRQQMLERTFKIYEEVLEKNRESIKR